MTFLCVRAEIETLHETWTIATPAEGVIHTHDTPNEPMTIVVGMWTRSTVADPVLKRWRCESESEFVNIVDPSHDSNNAVT